MDVLTTAVSNLTNETLNDDVKTAELPPEFDMETAKKMHFVTSSIFGTFFVIVGIVGNILSIFVWNRRKMRSSTGTYLIGQAIADMGLLVFFFITDSVPMMAPNIKTSYSYGVFFSYIGYPIFFLFVVCSIWFTVGVTVDRYIQVCWISHSKDLCNTRRAVTGLGIISTLCFIINIPHFCTFKPVQDEDRNITDDAFMQTTFGGGAGSQNYEFWVHCMFLVLAPVSSVFILNMLIIREVFKVNKNMSEKRSSMGKEKAQKSEAQLTRLLLTVTFTFLVLLVLQCVTQCFFMLKAGNHRIVSEAFSIAKLGIVINSSINFFLYCLSGKRFRKELKHMLCSRLLEGRVESTSYSLSRTSSSAMASTKVAMSSA